MSQGFAIRRNGTCLVSETTCGATVSPFFACCASGTFCSNPYNQVCCDSSSRNCTSAIVQRPVCSERTWDLYNNGGGESGYFCCRNTSTGYAETNSGSSGCADPSYHLRSGQNSLEPINQAVESPSSASPTASSTSTATPQSNPPEPSHSTTGPIVGGVVGGVGGLLVIITILVFFIFKRKRSRTLGRGNTDPTQSAFPAEKHHHDHDHHASQKSYLFGLGVRSELDSQTRPAVGELPSGGGGGGGGDGAAPTAKTQPSGQTQETSPVELA